MLLIVDSESIARAVNLRKTHRILHKIKDLAQNFWILWYWSKLYFARKKIHKLLVFKCSSHFCFLLITFKVVSYI